MRNVMNFLKQNHISLRWEEDNKNFTFILTDKTTGYKIMHCMSDNEWEKYAGSNILDRIMHDLAVRLINSRFIFEGGD